MIVCPGPSASNSPFAFKPKYQAAFRIFFPDFRKLLQDLIPNQFV